MLKILRKLTEPVPFHVQMSNHVGVDAETVGRYVSTPGTLDKYYPGLSNTTVTSPQGDQEGTYRSTMRCGPRFKLDMTWHPTADAETHKPNGLVMHGDYHGPAFMRSFGETLKISVRPAADGKGAVVTQTEDYALPRVLVPIFPCIRLSAHVGQALCTPKLEGILRDTVNQPPSP